MIGLSMKQLAMMFSLQVLALSTQANVESFEESWKVRGNQAQGRVAEYHKKRKATGEPSASEKCKFMVEIAFALTVDPPTAKLLVKHEKTDIIYHLQIRDPGEAANNSTYSSLVFAYEKKEPKHFSMAVAELGKEHMYVQVPLKNDRLGNKLVTPHCVFDVDPLKPFELSAQARKM